MAKPKHKVLTKVVSDNVIFVWCDNPTQWVDDIMSIDGVESVHIDNSLPFSVFTDARYDTEEIAGEIRDLLMAEIPQVFRE